MLLGLLDGADDVGRGARGGDADDGVLVVDVELLKVFPTLVGVVLGVFDGVAQGDVATGDEAYHPRGVHAKCGRDLAGVEDAETSRRAGTHVEDAAALFHAGNNLLDKLLNLGDGLLDGQGHLLVFGVDVGKYLVYRFLFKIVVKRGLLADFNKSHDSFVYDWLVR